MQILNLEEGTLFQMGKGQNWRVIHPDMGARQLTLNHSRHDPGHEFTQHTHGETEDVFVILEGGVSVRQGREVPPADDGGVMAHPPEDPAHGKEVVFYPAPGGEEGSVEHPYFHLLNSPA